jgi:two-component system, cell cycle sensor histidine kinase and response regulator CckA
MEEEKSELEAAHEMLRALVQSSPLAIIAINLEAQITMWNPAAERFFGWRQSEVLLKAIPIIPNVRADEFNVLFEQSQKGGSIASFRTQRKRKDGTLLDVSLSTATLHNQDGAITGMMGIYVDITEQRALEEQLKQSQKIEAIGRLAGGVAHDFNNLLTAIIGYSDLALNHLEDKDQLRKKIEEIKKTANRATSMTRQLLAYSRKQLIVPRVLDLNTIIQEMQKMFRQLIGEDIEVVTQLDETIGRVEADESQIQQVILNLIINARDAMMEGGTLRISTQNIYLDEAYANRFLDVQSGDHVCLSVADTGCGIEPKIQSQIFEPFFTTKEPGKGTGLGLSTVYGIVKQSNGHIVVESKVGEGTCFKVFLPHVDKKLEASSVSASSSSTLPHGTETILVVDDDESIRSLVSEVLRECGYKVLTANHGGEAVAICDTYKKSIDLLLSDVVMPHMSGRTLAENLSLYHPSIKMLFMSGYTDDVLVRHIVIDATPLFLQKPFTAEELAFKVREVLDQK